MTDDPGIMIYKILGTDEWRDATAAGVYAGSADDARDGFIHFSTAGQLAGTAARYFRDRPDLVLVAVPAARLGAALRWEPSRGGALFPHLYGRLEVAVAAGSWPLPLDASGLPTLPPHRSTPPTDHR